MNKPYQEYGENLNLKEASEFCNTSRTTFSKWVSSGKTPMGQIVEGVHYYKDGRNYHFIKRQLGILFKYI